MRRDLTLILSEPSGSSLGSRPKGTKMRTGDQRGGCWARGEIGVAAQGWWQGRWREVVGF